jgi:broad specificity phosphatase PhoE
MRHAEKSGDPKDPNLAPAGAVRARTLAAWLPQTFGRPDNLFASARSAHSQRPIQTLMPLATALRLPIDDGYADQDYGVLAWDLLRRHRYDGQFVVICWHHGHLPDFARDLGARKREVPHPWPDGVFNLVLQFDYAADGGVVVRTLTEPF